MKHIPCSLTIAGTDPSGGAGIHADLKTFQELKSYGMSVITSVVAQNTTGVQAIHHVPIEIIEKQLKSVISDMPVHALKTGMIANIDMMEVIAWNIPKFQAPFVMDPVMVATSGDALIEEQARDFLKEKLLPLTTVITPNIPEAEFLTGQKIQSVDDMKQVAKAIVHELGANAALVKGGHLDGEAIDFLYDGSSLYHFSAKRIPTKNTHGTGCTYSAAITAFLSQGFSLYDAVEKAKHFVTAAIKQSFSIGAGNGPTNHWALREDGVKQ
ncbi:bifunctional hydroxymethylpyrimidine kinase/phosphomethylpyrimidine kinase [Oceanobacillus senegalensis]|uniref:bifunctional hydroxymethylpyrimidine kinase/phosphomethylpyrimidine kinase n=1 Tax=Oceanobacillus senegalensis TaxID=1936063 RepID=UPI000A313207|nr:bifunctional hydroxymethylpyrimidine kinase/phosphomethylpyrimidine kinase [Oceanobacillus senegalensis]